MNRVSIYFNILLIRTTKGPTRASSVDGLGFLLLCLMLSTRQILNRRVNLRIYWFENLLIISMTMFWNNADRMSCHFTGRPPKMPIKQSFSFVKMT